MTPLQVYLHLDMPKFYDPETFGQSPIVNFLEVLGFTYAAESYDELEGAYLYELTDVRPFAILTQDWLQNVLKYFDTVELRYNPVDNVTLELVLPISTCIDLRAV